VIFIAFYFVHEIIMNVHLKKKKYIFKKIQYHTTCTIIRVREQEAIDDDH